jgi:hypothetical protein
MKRIIFITILTLTFSWNVFGQEITKENPFMQIDEYQNSASGSHKNIFDTFYLVLNNNPNLIGTIRLQSKNNNEILRQFKKFQAAAKFRQFSLERIYVAIISNSKEEKVEFWVNLPNVEIPNCNECIIIRAKDFQKIEELFKSITKKRKN